MRKTKHLSDDEIRQYPQDPLCTNLDFIEHLGQCESCRAKVQACINAHSMLPRNIAPVVGMSSEKVRQVKLEALKKLKESARDQ